MKFSLIQESLQIEYNHEFQNNSNQNYSRIKPRKNNYSRSYNAYTDAYGLEPLISVRVFISQSLANKEPDTRCYLTNAIFSGSCAEFQMCIVSLFLSLTHG